ncbi:electron transfer flavoprotein subunit alpha/FixB family protein [Niallia sp. 03133]|uniref:electron transfer flavoprotein subunit alpha/FixB family protein n=1 Tax=Niallia sp. 03133 TaxID=3458060 RepID=UPI004044786E
MGKVLIIGEMKQDQMRTVTMECLSAAKKVDDEAEIVVVLYGEDKTRSNMEELLYYNVHKIIWVQTKSSTFSQEAYGKMLESILKKEKPTNVIIPQTDFGKSLAPYLSEVLNIPLFSNIKDIKQENKALFLTRSVFSGKLNETIFLKEADFIAAIKPSSWELPAKQKEKPAVVEEIHLGKIKPIFPLVKVKKKENSMLDLLDAKVIVAGGRGIKNQEGMELIKKLALLLGGTVGVSRGAVELGLSDSSLQIGQTGKAVAPDIYIACGISGAIQHVVGMNGAKTVIAINNDPDAPIFKEADYCIVGDIFEVLPLLIKDLEDSK